MLTYHTDQKRYIMSEVKKVHSVFHKELYNVTLSNQESIVVTDDHPFYSSGAWMSINPTKTKQYKRYSDCLINQLEIGSELLSGMLVPIKVVDVSPIRKSIKIYTLEFEDDKVLFIANGILVGQE